MYLPFTLSNDFHACQYSDKTAKPQSQQASSILCLFHQNIRISIVCRCTGLRLHKLHLIKPGMRFFQSVGYTMQWIHGILGLWGCHSCLCQCIVRFPVRSYILHCFLQIDWTFARNAARGHLILPLPDLWAILSCALLCLRRASYGAYSSQSDLLDPVLIV